jgi:hypothetical protein
MAQRAVHHLLARGARQLPLQVVVDMIPGPVSERSYPCIDLGKFGDEGMVDIDGCGEVADQVLEELLTGAAGRSFDNGTQGGNIVAGHQLWRCAARSAPGRRCGSGASVRLRGVQHPVHRTISRTRARAGAAKREDQA